MSRVGAVNPAFIKHRDDQVAESVGKMAQLRKFEQEFTAYGSVECLPDGDLNYISTGNSEKFFQYRSKQQKKGHFFLPMHTYAKRSLVPAGMEDILPMAAKAALLSELKKQCEESQCIAKLSPLLFRQANDNAFDLLNTHRRRIEGYYDASKLELFLGLSTIAYEGKVLSLQTYLSFVDWVNQTLHEMEDNPIPGDFFHRVMYGFAYFSGSRVDCMYDAKKDYLLQKYEEKTELGLFVGPVLSKDFYLSNLNQMKDVRKAFSTELVKNGAVYVDELKEIRALPGVIVQEELDELKEQFLEFPYALRAIKLYGSKWNKNK